MNEKNHIYDDCIGNPPFAEAIKILEDGQLTEGQLGFFNGKQRIIDEITPTTENEKKLKNLAQFLLDQFRLLQIADNKRNAERNAEKERTKEILSRNNNRCSKAFSAMVACYRAIDRHFGDEIRANIEKNNRTQKEGQMRALMEQMQRLTK